jgi:aminopeptidase YwaD
MPEASHLCSMKYLLLTLSIICINLPAIAGGKKNKKAKQALITQLKKDIGYLASDELEGRRMGTPGEKLAVDYIKSRMQQIGLDGFFAGQYNQTFTVNQGKTLSEKTNCNIGKNDLTNTDFTPMPFGADGGFSATIMTAVLEKDAPAIIAASSVSKKSLANPHSDALSEYQQRAQLELEKGAVSVIFFNDIDSSYDFEFDATTKADTTFDAVCIFINYNAAKKYLLPGMQEDLLDIVCDVEHLEKSRTGYNVAGLLNNNAAQTIVFGAHLDHLGYGEDHNSLHTGKPAIHNGADDNASGVAAVLALAGQANSFSTKYNYLFVTFSGEELGLFGSKKFLEQNSNFIPQINCMINIDMLGRFDNQKNTITIGGVGSSPQWGDIINNTKKTFTAKFDSSGVGPSDHTSFYLKQKPVLFFFTGLHSDYHKPSDDADKINYEGEAMLINYIADITKEIASKPVLTYSKTREQKIEGVKFKVTLGIMPDYTFSGSGVRADGISEGKVAAKAGMQTGDIIISLGDYRVLDMESYMKALSKFQKGNSTVVTFNRGDKMIEKTITFE